MDNSSKMKVAVIGVGYWGPNLIRNFNSISDVEVSLVCDTNEDRLHYVRKMYPGIRVSKDFKDATRGSDIDLVCIATPVMWHYEMTKDALNNFKHVLVEKPLTDKVDSSTELVELAEKNKVVLAVDHTFEYTPAVNKIKSLIKSDELGQIYYVNMSRLNLGLFQKDINVVWDLAPHDISILGYVLDQSPYGVSANGSSHILPDIEDVAMLTIHYPNDILAYISVSWLDPNKIRKSTFVGSKKMLVYDDIEPLEKIKIYDKGVERPSYYDSFGNFQFSYRYGDIYTPYIDNKEPLQVECQHIVECIGNGTQPISDGRDGLKVVKILEAAEKSIKNKGRLELIES